MEIGGLWWCGREKVGRSKWGVRGGRRGKGGVVGENGKCGGERWIRIREKK